MAKQLARMLEPHAPLFIEEPLLPGHIEELKKLYQQTTIPIAVRVLYLFDFPDIARLGAGHLRANRTHFLLIFSWGNDSSLGTMSVHTWRPAASTLFSLISLMLEVSRKHARLLRWPRRTTLASLLIARWVSTDAKLIVIPLRLSPRC